VTDPTLHAPGGGEGHAAGGGSEIVIKATGEGTGAPIAARYDLELA
jgi:hypothetical protein